MESIPGYSTELSNDKIIENVKEIGISLSGQTNNLVPADKKIYALRDSISCTDSIPLIASSIMSKKIAAGANKIVLDVTVGKGAFMKNKEEAIKLANTMTKIGKLAEKETVCVITNMDVPLGTAIGNTLEIIEAISCLKGEMPQDIKEVIEEIGAYMMKLANRGNNIEENKSRIEEVIKNGKAYEKFCELVQKQGGDTSYIEDINKFEKAKFIVPVFAEEDGTIENINAEVIGSVSVYLGAGRTKKDDKIDHAVGIVLCKKIGDYAKIGETLAYVYANDEKKVSGAVDNIRNAYKLTNKKVVIPKTILGIVE